jgi:glycerol kinase
MKQYILTIDQGSTSTKVLLIDHDMNVAATGFRELVTYNPRQGWVEHDAEAIWDAVVECAHAAMEKAGVTGRDIAGIGITNQRETFVLWERVTGKPVIKAISWQCKRGVPICESIKADRPFVRW